MQHFESKIVIRMKERLKSITVPYLGTNYFQILLNLNVLNLLFSIYFVHLKNIKC